MPVNLDSRWPGWPEGEPGQAALDVALDTPVDAAFLLIYGGNNEMRVRTALAARQRLHRARSGKRAAPAAAYAHLHWSLCSPAPQRALDEANGNKDFSTTAWLPSAEAVEAAAAEPSPPPLDAGGLAALRPGWLRRASYSGSMMGSKVGAGTGADSWC